MADVTQDRMARILARFNEIETALASGAAGQDIARLSREHARLQPVVEVARALRAAQAEHADLEELLNDPEMAALARDELAALEERIGALRRRLRELLLPKDAADERDVIVEVRAGTGGEEAALFAADLFRMYQRYAQGRGWRVEVMSASESERGGYREIVAAIAGKGAYARLKYESGVHRVQRVPETESGGRIHTSAATVAVLPEAEEVDVAIDEKDLRIDVFRASGPGGQSVNTTDSAVRITHLPTGLGVTCPDEKSQHKNKAKALKILRARLLDQMQAEREAKLAAERRSMVKSGDRSEKIRTYNFPQDRLTDHRIGLTLHNLPRILQGELDDVVTALRTHYQAEALRGQSET